MQLSKEQQIAYTCYMEGHNVFITGPGGSGKSELIRMIYENARKRYKNIHITAMTGCAAMLLSNDQTKCNPTTLHSWSGIGLGTESIEHIVHNIRCRSKIESKWKEVKILVVDEVSMLSKKLFQLLNEIGKIIRRNNKPFGGIQLIFSGDFFQLPPVGNDENTDSKRFCFECDEWNEVFNPLCQVQLNKIFRQQDGVFSKILNQIRIGRVTQRTINYLSSLVGRKYENNLIVAPTKLFATRMKVNALNERKMAELEGEVMNYEIISTINRDDFVIIDEDGEQIDYVYDMYAKKQKLLCVHTKKECEMELNILLRTVPCQQNLSLKKGASVMCLINIKNTDKELELCNGSQGIVMGFTPKNNFPIVHFNNGVRRTMKPYTWASEKILYVTVSQIPLILSWAMTIHKSQGATLDAVEIDAGGDVFEYGQTYVALSRVRSLEGLYLSEFDATRIQVHIAAKEYYENLSDRWASRITM